MSNLTIERATAPTPEVVRLIGALDAYLGALYTPDQQHGLRLDALFEPHVRFFVARLDGEAVGCGAIVLFDGHAEVKRMFTTEAARARGVATAVLARLEDEARVEGRSLLRLETGIHQHEALILYERRGFTRCDPFPPYTDMAPHQIGLSRFYEKLLD
ncbi:MAG: GNAT family N-acetyltransferase [Dehalococcoidia bacterium]